MRVHLLQLADDLLDVPARAEAAPAAGDHDHPGVLAGEAAEQVAQVGVGLERERIELVGPVERDRHHAVGDCDVEVLPPLGRVR